MIVIFSHSGDMTVHTSCYVVNYHLILLLFHTTFKLWMIPETVWSIVSEYEWRSQKCFLTVPQPSVLICHISWDSCSVFNCEHLRWSHLPLWHVGGLKFLQTVVRVCHLQLFILSAHCGCFFFYYSLFRPIFSSEELADANIMLTKVTESWNCLTIQTLLWLAIWI